MRAPTDLIAAMAWSPPAQLQLYTVCVGGLRINSAKVLILNDVEAPFGAAPIDAIELMFYNTSTGPAGGAW